MEYKELTEAISTIKKNIEEAQRRMQLPQLREQVSEYEARMNEPDFWNEQTKAQETISKLKAIKSRVETWENLVKNAQELAEFIELAGEAEKAFMEEEYLKLKSTFDKASLLLYFNQPHDKEDVVFSIVSGAGGDDAEDFAGMLLRMYSMYFDAHGFSYEIFEFSEGAGASGIKKVTLEIHGEYAHGTLRGERGVHRLVRLSPFKSSDSRQTSFALVEVLPLIRNIGKDDVVVEEKDLRIDTFRSSGAGGQKVNKTDSAVRITHLPTGISVACQVERSQHQNKERAMEALRSRLYQLKLEEQAKAQEGLKGEVVSVDWGKQIRSYVLHPYKMVKDHRTEVETSQVEKVLNGELEEFIEAEIRMG